MSSVSHYVTCFEVVLIQSVDDSITKAVIGVDFESLESTGNSFITLFNVSFKDVISIV